MHKLPGPDQLARLFSLITNINTNIEPFKDLPEDKQIEIHNFMAECLYEITHMTHEALEAIRQAGAGKSVVHRPGGAYADEEKVFLIALVKSGLSTVEARRRTGVQYGVIWKMCDAARVVSAWRLPQHTARREKYRKKRQAVLTMPGNAKVVGRQLQVSPFTVLEWKRQQRRQNEQARLEEQTRGAKPTISEKSSLSTRHRSVEP